MEPWREANLMVRLIEQGQMDAHLTAIGLACTRRLTKLHDEKRPETNSAPGECYGDRCKAADAKARRVVFETQAKVAYRPGDIVLSGEWAPWRFRHSYFKVLRVSQKTLFARPLDGPSRPQWRGYALVVGVKLDKRDVTPVIEVPSHIEALAAKVPIRERLVIKKRGPEATGDQA